MSSGQEMERAYSFSPEAHTGWPVQETWMQMLVSKWNKMKEKKREQISGNDDDSDKVDKRTSPVSWLKYSTVYWNTGDAPWVELGLHDTSTLESVTSVTEGFEGDPGNVDGSGVRWKMTDGFVGVSTTSAAPRAVSPVSLTARHV